MNAVINKRMLSGRWRLGGAVLIIVAAFSLGGAGIALGARSSDVGSSSASDEYPLPPPPPKVVAAKTGTSGGTYKPPTATTASKGTLPFTGVSLIWPAVAAVVLVGLGLGLRRHERKS